MMSAGQAGRGTTAVMPAELYTTIKPALLDNLLFVVADHLKAFK